MDAQITPQNTFDAQTVAAREKSLRDANKQSRNFEKGYVNYFFSYNLPPRNTDLGMGENQMDNDINIK
jgi:hypothetical protein